MIKPATTVVHTVDRANRKIFRLPEAHRSQAAFFRQLKRAGSHRAQTRQIACLRDAIVVTAIGKKEIDGGTIVALSGPKGQEGTSLISLLLTHALGNCTHRRIAWIDGGFSSERFAALADVLELSPASITFRKGGSELAGYSDESRPNVVFFKNSTDEKSLDFFSDHRLGRFLSEVRHHFDFTVIDMPPLMRETSNLFLMPLVDRFYLVGVPRQTAMSEIHKCISTAQQAGGEISGVILNKQRAPIWSRFLWRDFFFS